MGFFSVNSNIRTNISPVHESNNISNHSTFMSEAIFSSVIATPLQTLHVHEKRYF